MSFFKATKAKEKLNPRPAESIFGGNWLMNEMNWNTPDYPVRPVAAMTAGEQAAQDNIYGYMQGGTEAGNLALDHTRKTIEGGYDPRDSDFYSGYRAEMTDMRNDSNARLKRRSQIGGMANSTPAAGVEAENNRRIDQQQLQTLGSMYENERGRMDTAANRAAGMDQQKFDQTLAADAALSKQRQIEQMNYDAIYNAAYQELMHQYNVLAPIASNMMGYSPGTWSQEGGPSGLQTAVDATNGFMSIGSAIGSVASGNFFTPTI